MTYVNKKLFNILLAATILLFQACSSDDESGNDDIPALVSAEIGFTGNSQLAKDIIAAFEIDVDLDLLQYDMELYKVVYNTTYKGEQIQASGVVILPKTEDPVGMLSFQHGTILADSEAPSRLSSADGSTFFYASMASPGLIAVIPDYIGYAESGDVTHPYLIEEPYANAVIDNIKAAVELANDKGLNFNGDLYLAGYSEGGYATMVAHKAIEQQGIDGITLKASFPGAGIYNLTTTAAETQNTETLNNPEFYSFRLFAYYDHHDLGLELTDIWNEPYASRVSTLFDGSKTGPEAAEQLNANVTELLASDYINSIETDSKYEAYRNAEIENNVLDWTPTVRMYLSHGDADLVVPYQATVDAYNYFIDNGVSPNLVTFETYEGLDHGPAVAPYLEDVFNVLADEL